MRIVCMFVLLAYLLACLWKLLQLLLHHDLNDTKGILSEKHVMLSAKCRVWVEQSQFVFCLEFFFDAI